MLERFQLGLATTNITMPEGDCRRELLFLNELLRWNRRINLTAIKTPEEALEKHLIDALQLLPYLGVNDRVLDMGSGGGLPGIPLAIARGDLQIISVDAVGKKINFQKHIRRLLGLEKLEPVHCRLEDLQTVIGEPTFDLVLARAFASFATIAALAGPCLQKGGRVLAMKGQGVAEELEGAAEEIAAAGLVVEKTTPYRLPFSLVQRYIVELRLEP